MQESNVVPEYCVLSKNKVVGGFYTKTIEYAQRKAAELGGVVTTIAQADKILGGNGTKDLGLVLREAHPYEIERGNGGYNLKINRATASHFRFKMRALAMDIGGKIERGAKLTQPERALYDAMLLLS